MTKNENALELFACGYNCAQSVLGAYCDELGLSRETAFKIASGFGGGMRQGEVCGAVTGALMVIGLKEGFYAQGDVVGKAHIAERIIAFEAMFEEKNGSLLCKTLLGYNPSNEADLRIIKEKGLFTNLCPKFIDDGVILTEKVLIS
ncbi:MAG: hypothetical protein CVU95_10420 [Firmicutes bacterium HGW-Firmicutes-2]|jgi:C_GCAxxG_C_C family probable redox protein|nr:MAG: hypothetical protein CVU95_10420 [Firmicutes bacterium HGW-Firmicutes-2]